MPRRAKGSTYRTRNGVGIRWTQAGKRQHKSGFRNKTEAHDWWDHNIAPALRRGGPSAEITLNEFTTIYLERWAVDKADRTRTTLQAWLTPALDTFGQFTLRELEGAVDDISRWRANLPTDDRRHKATRALRQVLAAAVRWGYIARNAAVDAGANPAARSEEMRPLTPVEVARIVEELGPRDAAIVTLGVETGLRTHEWIALERRDVDRHGLAVTVQRRVTDGKPIPYPKTSRRRVPLTPAAVRALEGLPPRVDTPILFPSESGGHLNLNNFRNRVWTPALQAAGVERRGPYILRHSFATNALAAGISLFQLSRLMGTSVKMIDATYGHLVQDSEAEILARLTARQDVVSRTIAGET